MQVLSVHIEQLGDFFEYPLNQISDLKIYEVKIHSYTYVCIVSVDFKIHETSCKQQIHQIAFCQYCLYLMAQNVQFDFKELKRKIIDANGKVRDSSQF